MLVLSRQIGEWLVIDTPQGLVRVQVTQIRGLDGNRRVSLGIDAPKSIKILRAEVQDRDERAA